MSQHSTDGHGKRGSLPSVNNAAEERIETMYADTQTATETPRNLYDLQSEVQKLADSTLTAAREIADAFTGGRAEKNAPKEIAQNDVLSRTRTLRTTLCEVMGELQRTRQALGISDAPSSTSSGVAYRG